MHTPEPTPIRPLSFAESFWALAPGPETDDTPEPLRSVVIVRQFLAALDKLDGDPRRASPALIAMLRQAEIAGDLSHASPEQVRGETLDTRSVVFSIGVVLFERLTGRHPFGAENNRPRQVERIRRGELGSGVNSFPTVAAGLRSVLVRAMSPFPEERWPELRQVRELLGQFCTQESPPPRLPGTTEDGEETKVVRMATEFGRELMQVVARLDREPTPIPSPGPRTSQRLAVPTAGVGSVGAPTRAKLRTVPPPVPAPPTPSVDSVVTRIRDVAVDPLADTTRLVIDDLPVANDDSVASLVTPTPIAPPHAMPPPLPSSAISTPAALPYRPDSLAAVDLRAGTPRRRTLLIAGTSALIGAGVAVALVVLLQSPPSQTPPVAASAITAHDPVPVPVPVPVPDPKPAPVAAPPAAPAPVAAAAPVAPAPTGNLAGTVATAIKPCVAPPHHGARIFGLSFAFHASTIKKAYFDSGDGLSPAEHGCIGKAVRGLAVTDPPSGDAMYRVRVDDGGVALSPLGS